VAAYYQRILLGISSFLLINPQDLYGKEKSSHKQITSSKEETPGGQSEKSSSHEDQKEKSSLKKEGEDKTSEESLNQKSVKEATSHESTQESVKESEAEKPLVSDVTVPSDPLPVNWYVIAGSLLLVLILVLFLT